MKAVGMAAIVMAGLLAAASAGAQQPIKENPNAKRHPNLNAAYRLVQQAQQKIQAARVANEFDMEGHADKANGLLGQAEVQLNAAANWAAKNEK